MTFRLHTPVLCYFRAWKLFQRRSSVVHDNDYSTHHFNDSYICSTTTNGGNSSLEWIYHHIHVQVIYIIYVHYIHQLLVITCYYTGYIYAAFHPTQDLSLVLLHEMFGSDLADATARQAEYQWDLADDGTSDPFSHTIPMP